MSKKIKIIILIAVAVLVITVVSIVILINSKGYKDTLVKSDLRSLSEEFYSYYCYSIITNDMCQLIC